MIHVLPDGFNRIRYYGFLGNHHGTQKLELCRALIGMAPPAAGTAPATNYRQQFEALTGQSLHRCPHCGAGIMVVISRIAPAAIGPAAPDTS